MAAFPTVKYDWRELAESVDPVVAREAMERGLPKQRRVSSDARVEVSMTIYFDTLAEAADFEAWFFTTIKAGQDFFDFTPPRGGSTVQARVVGGQLGPLQYQQKNLQASKRSLKVEYLRAAY